MVKEFTTDQLEYTDDDPLTSRIVFGSSGGTFSEQPLDKLLNNLHGYQKVLMANPELSHALIRIAVYGLNFVNLSEYAESSEDYYTYFSTIFNQVDEGKANQLRLRQFNIQYKDDFLRIICEQDFEYGLSSQADLFIAQLLNINASVTKEWLNSLFIENFRNSRIILGLLQVVSHLEYIDANPEGPTMALAALSHSDPEVRECAIRAFENWESADSLNVLRGVKYSEEWLQEYAEKVIVYLEGSLAKNGTPGQED